MNQQFQVFSMAFLVLSFETSTEEDRKDVCNGQISDIIGHVLTLNSGNVGR